MTVEQRTFIPQGVKLTMPKNGVEAFPVPEPKPLTPEQLSVIETLRSPRDKLIAQLLVNGRKQGTPVTTKELAAIYIPTIRNRKPITDDEEEIDSEVIERRVYNNIPRSLRPKFEPVGLFIINYYRHTGKKGGSSSYVLKTKEELPSQEELAQFRTLKDVSEAIGEPSPQAVHSKLYSAMTKDPTIEVLYLPDAGNSRTIYLTQADFEKSIKTMNATKTAAKNGTDKKPDNISDTQDEKPQNKKRSQHDELHERAMLGRTPEQIREELTVHFTNVILSHLASDCIEELTKSPRELLEKALRAKIRLDSIIKESPEQFLMDRFIERLRALWPIVGTHPKDSVLQIQAVEYCLDLKRNGHTIEKIIEVVCDHFSIPIPTSAPELESPKDSGLF